MTATTETAAQATPSTPTKFCLRSAHQPDGYYVGISPVVADETKVTLQSYLKYADIGQAILELKACLAHAEQANLAMVAQTSYAAGQRAAESKSNEAAPS